MREELTFSKLSNAHSDWICLVVTLPSVDETLGIEHESLEVLWVEGECLLTVLNGKRVELAHFVAASSIREVN